MDLPACQAEIRYDGNTGAFVWRLCVRSNDGTTIKDLKLPADVATGQWVHFVGVYDQAGGKVSIYINGQELGSATDIVNVGMAGDWDGGAKIGSTADWGRQFVGTLDEL
jgi:hypothetical protein